MFSMSKRNFLVGMAFGMVIIFAIGKVQLGTWNKDLLFDISSEKKGIQINQENSIWNVPVPEKLPITTENLPQIEAISKDEKLPKSTTENLPQIEAISKDEKLPKSTTDENKNNASCHVPPISTVEQFFGYENKEKHCKNLVLFGGRNKKRVSGKYYDGGKWVCLDKEYDIKPGNCTVLSFGIANDWSFDDAMDKYGCKVFSFDPTIGKADHNRSENIQFFNLGLSNTKEVKTFGKKKGNVDRLQNILQKLNLIDHEIDYMKIDIEGSEINFFNDIFSTSPQLLDNVKQIGMEIHPGVATILIFKVTKSSSFYKLWKGMHQLECAGFKLLNFEQNLAGKNPYKWKNRQVSACSELVWGRVPA